jgi:hypothetical protein
MVMRTINAMIFAASLVTGIASAAYAGSVTVEGGTLTQEPRASDKFALRSSQTGEMCVTVCNGGPYFDTSFGATIKSSTTGAKTSVFAPVGGCATTCVANSQRASIFIFCNESLSECDDVYSAEFTCPGEIVKFTQEGNE